ncbi:unnamed protein product [marine sediment metagenome]|uniref:Uncharacterized protein n=1 Tax=marine sediment metagenome TaxID=412755 RepID=X0UE59_9ZZZZ
MSEETKGLRPEDYQDAITVQDASNLSGVIVAFGKVIDRMRHDRVDVRTHPITRLFGEQVAWLSGGGSSALMRCTNTYNTARLDCEIAAKGESGVVERIAQMGDKPGDLEEYRILKGETA